MIHIATEGEPAPPEGWTRIKGQLFRLIRKSSPFGRNLFYTKAGTVIKCMACGAYGFVPYPPCLLQLRCESCFSRKLKFATIEESNTYAQLTERKEA